MPTKKTHATTVRALERGLEIIDLFCQHAEPLTLTAIASAVNLTPSTTLRMLGTLEKAGYITREEEGKRFIPGNKLIRLAAPFTHKHALSMLALPHMKKLRDQFGETISIYMPAGEHRVCLQRVETPQSLREVVNIGDILPLGIGGAGKILSAWLCVSSKNKPFSTPTNLSAQELETIRKKGYAIGLDERKAGVYGIAGPIFDWSGDILASLSISGPMVRFTQEKLPEMTEAIMLTSALISQLVGWTPKSGT